MSVERSRRRSKRLLTRNLKSNEVQDRQIVSSDDEDLVGRTIDLTKTPSKLSCKKPSKSKEVRHASSSLLNSSQESSDDYTKDLLVTPPKHRKIANNENAPVNSPTTPIVMLEKLALDDGEYCNRRKLSRENDAFQNARKALHSSYPVDMPGRERELKELKDFIIRHMMERSSGSMYISGPPGTGKTASLNLILQEEQMSKLRNVYINCTSIKSSGSIFSKIAKELGMKSIGKNEKDCINTIDAHLKKNNETTLLVLDEIDQLESKNQSVLYKIFEWPARDCKLILIGIANALDLTDRILPRLQTRCELKPKLMHFTPYTKQQIVEIFTNRLKSAGVMEIFSPLAVQMLAGKVAAISGDVRRALDIGRRVVELADRKKKGENMLRSVENLAEALEVDKTEAVDLEQIVNVLNSVYGASQQFSQNIDDSFPLQQKIIVCSLLLILKRAKNRDVSVGRLYEVYRKVCLKRNIQVVDQGEFVGLCSLIETRSILKMIKKQDPRMNKISLMWDEEEVAEVLKDKLLMSSVLQDNACLGNL